MNDFTVEVISDEEIEITVTASPASIIDVDDSPPNTVVEVNDVAFPGSVNMDGGNAFSIFGGIPPIDGGGA